MKNYSQGNDGVILILTLENKELVELVEDLDGDNSGRPECVSLASFIRWMSLVGIVLLILVSKEESHHRTLRLPLPCDHVARG
ncbi:uncharacterized protein EDB93DRAFT_1334579, partial [Suillus bovinus]|uniref:uncharacterized protein n=1 Tax=Suillus bovinus TaxID=48563 RepID=UPI001B8723C5